MRKLLITLVMVLCFASLVQADEIEITFTVQGDADSISLYHRLRDVSDEVILAREGFVEDLGFPITSPILWEVPYGPDEQFCMFPSVKDSNGDEFAYKDIFCFQASPAPPDPQIIDVSVDPASVVIIINVEHNR